MLTVVSFMSLSVLCIGLGFLYYANGQIINSQSDTVMVYEDTIKKYDEVMNEYKRAILLHEQRYNLLQEKSALDLDNERMSTLKILSYANFKLNVEKDPETLKKIDSTERLLAELYRVIANGEHHKLNK